MGLNALQFSSSSVADAVTFTYFGVGTVRPRAGGDGAQVPVTVTLSGLALVAVASINEEASVSKRPALARQQPSPFGDVSRTIWASDKYRGDLGRSLFLTVFGPGVIIAVLIGARCRDPPRRRRKNVPVAHARYDGEAEAGVADASDDDELDLLPAARPVHRNPFGSPGRPQSREV